MKEEAIRNTHPSVSTIHYNNIGEVSEALDSEGNSITLDENKIKTEQDKLQAEYDAQDYARARKEEYPSYAEQFDILYHKGVAGLKAELKKTKDKYPKG